MEIRRKYERLSRLLSPVVKTKIRQLVPQYLAHAGHRQNAHTLHESALAALRIKFPLASPAQSEHLAFYLLSIAATVNGDGKGGPGALNDMTEVTSMRLQMLMDQRSKFIEALSNIMKKTDSTDDSIVQNLKG